MTGALETQQNAHMDRVGNSTQRFPKGRVLRSNLQSRSASTRN
ncbi:hypothetical protein LEP1GSC041_4604 [Leptospira noguchii str. 2006001870]|nr:hypothetical protein LEP1GSC041_4604 [Leptospira noguchii str. 2006001870]